MNLAETVECARRVIGDWASVSVRAARGGRAVECLLQFKADFCCK